PRPQGHLHNEAIFILALLTLLLLAYTRRYFGTRLMRHWQAFWNFRLAMQLMREDSSTGAISLAYGITSACIITLSVYAGVNNMVDYGQLFKDEFSLTASFSVGFVLTWSRQLWIGALKLVSGGINGLQEYAFCTRMSYLVLGIMLFLPLVCSVYCRPGSLIFFSWLIFSMFAITQLVLWIRGVQLAIFYRIPLYYLFFYICTLEILPGALVLKYFCA
ncbi:MAG: DUF4271 domain-containing protein, partial [Flavobacteriales bacterium]